MLDQLPASGAPSEEVEPALAEAVQAVQAVQAAQVAQAVRDVEAAQSVQVAKVAEAAEVAQLAPAAVPEPPSVLAAALPLATEPLPAILADVAAVAAALELPDVIPTSAPVEALGDELDVKGVDKKQSCNVEDPKLGDIVELLVCKPFPQEWKRCALVGGSSDLINKSLGARIDAYDTVLRVNRVPSAEFFHDFGERTDVLFAGAVAESVPMFQWAGYLYRRMGGNYEMCTFYDKVCPFQGLILKGSDVREYRQRWQQRYPRQTPGWKPRYSSFPFAYQQDSVNEFAYDLVGSSAQRPTTGFQAFLTFALICDSLDVYGFSGSSTADGHRMKKVHNLTREHEIQHHLFGGDQARAVAFGESLLKGNPGLHRKMLERILGKWDSVHKIGA